MQHRYKTILYTALINHEPTPIELTLSYGLNLYQPKHFRRKGAKPINAANTFKHGCITIIRVPNPNFD